MNVYIKTGIRHCLLYTHLIFTQEQEVPSLRSLALSKVAEKLYQELSPEQSSDDRKHILDEWELQAGILFKPHYRNQQGNFAQSNPKTESILERFEKKYGLLLKTTEFNENCHIVAISNDNSTCYYKKRDRNWWSAADIATREKLHDFTGHRSHIAHVAFTSDKAHAVTASLDNTIKLWDINTRRCVRTLIGHTHWVNYVTLTADNSKALSASLDHSIRVWDLKNGDCLHTFPRQTNTFAITSDNAKMLSASDDHSLNLWDLNTGISLLTFNAHTQSVEQVAITSNNTQAVSCSADSTLKLWDLNTGNCLWTYQVNNAWITRFVLTSDNTKALCATIDRTLKLIDLKTGTCLRTFEKNLDFIISIALAQDGLKALSADSRDVVKLWDITSGECIQIIAKAPTSSRGIVTHNNLVALGNSIYRFENWQEIIQRMPQPQQGKSGTSACLVNGLTKGNTSKLDHIAGAEEQKNAL